jgi:hypothetical protein
MAKTKIIGDRPNKTRLLSPWARMIQKLEKQKRDSLTFLKRQIQKHSSNSTGEN